MLVPYGPAYADASPDMDSNRGFKSYGNIIYEEDGGTVKICSGDIAVLAEKLSSIPEAAYDPAIFSVAGNRMADIPLPYVHILEDTSDTYEMENEPEAEYETVDEEQAEKAGDENIEELGEKAGMEDGSEKETQTEDAAGMEEAGQNKEIIENGFNTEVKTDAEERPDTEDLPDKEEIPDDAGISSNDIENIE